MSWIFIYGVCSTCHVFSMACSAIIVETAVNYSVPFFQSLPCISWRDGDGNVFPPQQDVLISQLTKISCLGLGEAKDVTFCLIDCFKNNAYTSGNLMISKLCFLEIPLLQMMTKMHAHPKCMKKQVLPTNAKVKVLLHSVLSDVFIQCCAIACLRWYVYYFPAACEILKVCCGSCFNYAVLRKGLFQGHMNQSRRRRNVDYLQRWQQTVTDGELRTS